MVDILWAGIGFLVGVVAAAFAIEFGLRKFLSPPDVSKLTQVWALNEFPTPLIASTAIEGVAVPANARLLTAGRFGGDRGGFELRTNPDTRGNFVVDARANRALLFLDGVRPGALALWSIDPKLTERLRAEFNRLWSRSTDYVERVAIADVPKKANHTVETEGVVADLVPYKGNYLLRLTDHGEAVGVLVERELPVVGRRVHVTGIVRASSSGYPLIEAVEVKVPAA